MDYKPDPYPYGLELHLNKDEMKKLGITEMPKLGAVLMIYASAKVESASKSAGKQGEDMSMTLQITDMGIEKPKVSKIKMSLGNLGN